MNKIVQTSDLEKEQHAEIKMFHTFNCVVIQGIYNYYKCQENHHFRQFDYNCDDNLICCYHHFRVKTTKG